MDPGAGLRVDRLSALGSRRRRAKQGYEKDRAENPMARAAKSPIPFARSEQRMAPVWYFRRTLSETDFGLYKCVWGTGLA
jgi:hypothetical protein